MLTAGIPAWSLTGEAPAVPPAFPEAVTRDWAWGGSTGAGVRLCILDSGVETTHPAVGEIVRSVALTD
jgi:hypothetical protein